MSAKNTQSNHSELEQAEDAVRRAAAAATETLLQLIVNPHGAATVDRLSGLFDDVKLAAERLSMLRDVEVVPQRQPLDPEEAALDARTGYSEQVEAQ
jgi:hypothetical protein